MTGGNLSGAIRYSLFQSEHFYSRIILSLNPSCAVLLHCSTAGRSPASGCHGSSWRIMWIIKLDGHHQPRDIVVLYLNNVCLDAAALVADEIGSLAKQ